MIKVLFLTFFLFINNCYSLESGFNQELNKVSNNLKEFKLLEARENIRRIQASSISNEEWIKLRDLIHQYPQIGWDFILKFDQNSPFKLNKIDMAIQKADKLMLDKKFRDAAYGYQVILSVITKNKKFKSGRNYLLYWSLIHSLARAYYGLKQYDEAFVLYRTIPSSYQFYKQVQFELMWNNYMNNRLEYSLGAIATMSSGHFSKILEPEVYLLQYYIYRRMCRDEEVGVIIKRVKAYQEVLAKFKFPLGNWIKKDVETLVYRQVLQSGDAKSKEGQYLKAMLENRMNKDVKRLQKEFDLVAAHLDLENGKNKNLEPIKSLLTVDQLLANSNEKWAVDDNEIWLDELGKQVFIQKDLCKKDVEK